MPPALAYDYESSPSFVGPPGVYQWNANDQADADVGQAIAANGGGNTPPAAEPPPNTPPPPVANPTPTISTESFTYDDGSSYTVQQSTRPDGVLIGQVVTVVQTDGTTASELRDGAGVLQRSVESSAPDPDSGARTTTFRDGTGRVIAQIEPDAHGQPVFYRLGADGALTQVSANEFFRGADLGASPELQAALRALDQQTVASAGTLPMPPGSLGVLEDALARGARLAIGAGGQLLLQFVNAAGATLTIPIVIGAAAMATPANIGQETAGVTLQGGLRWQVRTGEQHGRLELPSTQWLGVGDPSVLITHIDRERAAIIASVLAAAQSLGLTDAERLKLIEPLITPLPNQPRPNVMIFPGMSDSERAWINTLPPFDAPPSPEPTILDYPAVGSPHWRDFIIEKSNAARLAEALIKGNDARPADGYVPHHIGPFNKWPELDYLRDKFKDWNIGLNDAANGVWLPGYQANQDAPGSYHERLHNIEYLKAIQDAFLGVTRNADARAALAEIKDQLKAGNFAGSRPRSEGQ